MKPARQFPTERNYSSLSIRDLLDARDHYHLHLAHSTTVVATAIGRYRIRKGDFYATHPPSKTPPKNYKKPTVPRTIFNSVVTDWSWPCVMVFVDNWIARGEFSSKGEHDPDQVVPRALYLPDGRVVPTCVILLDLQNTPVATPHDYRFPTSFIGGGYPVLSRVQGREHVGSVGCLVTDGRTTFALTNRHVAGEPNEPIYSILGGNEVRVGVADAKQIGKKPFSDVYKGWPGAAAHCNIDAGLIRVDDVSRWTTQILGVGELDTLIDLNTDTISLDLVDCNVRGFGAASGELYGSIVGFFYRYKSVGGIDYVADLIIAPRPDPNDRTKTTNTLPGDSGTLWCLEQTTEARQKKTHAPFPMRFRPLALEWGAQVTSERGAKSMSATSFTLATALSTICRELDVDVVRGWNSGLPEYWGAVGHYTIAAIACQRAGAAKSKLRTLMTNNLERVSYTRATIEKGARAFKGLTKEPFIALADVPDYAWKGGARSGEQPNHFADMDAVVPEGNWEGKTLLELCKDPKNVDLGVWQEYYKLVKDRSKGILPFRVWQIFNAMTKYAKAKDVARFVAAAGVLAHYVGDACQPLHISYMYDGEPAEGGGKRGKGVHHAYEAVMFNAHVAELWDGIETKLAKKKLAKVTTGRDAALLTIALMRETFDLIEPSEIVDAYAKGSDLWKKFRDRTAKTMANGVTYLTHLWESAWTTGHGDTIAQKKLGTIDEERLTKICDDEKFLPSMRIGMIGEEL